MGVCLFPARSPRIKTPDPWHAPVSLSIYDNQGSDQIAQQSSSGIWGIFEAKGGRKAKLGDTKGYGTQMSGDWITHWIQEVLKKNGTDAHLVRAAFNAPNPKPILAGPIKLVIIGRKTPPVEMRFAFQAYRPPDGSNMSLYAGPWPSIWYNPTNNNY